MKIQGIGNMSSDQLRFEIQRGAKIVCYNYGVSILVMTFRRSPITFLRGRAQSPKDCLGPCSRWWRAGGGFRGDRSSLCNRWSLILKVEKISLQQLAER